MAHSSNIDAGDLREAADRIGAAASAVSSEARRAARAATSEAARAARHNGETVRNVFHDLADEAEAKARDATTASGAVVRRIANGASEQPLVALAAVAVAAALFGFVLGRR